MSFTKQLDEITFEITDFCENNCKFCSSDAKKYNASFLSITEINKYLVGCYYKQIHLSGGEPLSHPDFYHILKLCKSHSDDVIVHTNAIKHIAFNMNVIDNIYVEGYISVTNDVDKVHILKRVEQGKEKTRPEVKFSGNWLKDCSNCGHIVIRADGKQVKSPCDKETEVNH